MSFSYETIDLMQRNHPAWRLLCAEHAPLVISFVHRVFIEPNVRVMQQADLVEALEDQMFALRAGQDSLFPKAAVEYLNNWASPDRGWLRKFYVHGSDEPSFDVTPSTEKAISWLGTLTERSFVGTESRLLTLFELLRQMSEGSETNPEVRVVELQKRRNEIDAQIARVLAGEMNVIGDTALKDRFQQFVQLSRDLLADFREVEQNFRTLDRHVRERIALWDGSKGALLDEIMGERDAIAESDQGRSFRAFWDFLMSGRRQEELTVLLERVLNLPAVAGLNPDSRLRRVHYDWLDAGEHTQRTVSELSKQLRRFLDDQAWLENRRIMDILREIESQALAVRISPPVNALMEIDDIAPGIDLPLERPLFKAAAPAHLTELISLGGDADVDAAALFCQIVVDKVRLTAQVREALIGRSQVTLREVCSDYPLQYGLAELVGYMQLSGEGFSSLIDEGIEDTIVWTALLEGQRHMRQARLPRVVFVRAM